MALAERVAPIDRLLEAAEELEARAAAERVEYYAGLSDLALAGDGKVLDVGCGNGYAVAAWRRRGVPAFGVDRSLYRLSRWVEQAEPGCPLVVADAAALPLRASSFAAVVSSGMIEHVGVSESSDPYTVTPHPERGALRLKTLCELVRVAGPAGAAYVDCPNGSFPVDFWHGDRLGAFRLHPVPDTLLPSFGDFRRWSRRGRFRVRLLPLTGRLRFRQIRHRWWGRLLAPAVSIGIRLLDRLLGRLLGGRLDPLLALAYPYLVVMLLPAEERSEAGSLSYGDPRPRAAAPPIP